MPAQAGASPAAMTEAELSDETAAALYREISARMYDGYRKSGNATAGIYFKWQRYNRVPFVSATHGGLYVNVYANAIARRYGRFERAGPMPVGAIIAKDGFEVTADGEVRPGPLVLMEKMPAGSSLETGDWRYTVIFADGRIHDQLDPDTRARVAFCAECHGAVSDQDCLFFIPERYRIAARESEPAGRSE